MKLTQEELKFITTSAQTAVKYGVESIIIDSTGVRGWNDERTVYVRQEDNVPPLSFEEICITRIPLFLSRYEIAKVIDGFAANITLHDDGWVQSVGFTGKGARIDYRGSNPIKNKIPPTLKDERATSCKLSGESVSLMKKGESAMGAKLVTLISNDEVTFEFTDVNNDVFSYAFPDKATALTDDNITKFAHKYPVKVILSLFNHDPTGYFLVGGRIGTLSVEIDDMTVYIIPQK